MSRVFKNSVQFLILTAMVFVSFGVSLTNAQDNRLVSSLSAMPFKTAEEVIAYWTPERMAKAIPYPMPELEATQAGNQAVKQDVPVGKPGLVTGTLPGRPQDGGVKLEVPDTKNYTPMDYTPYTYPGPFSRWTWFGRYMTYPISTIGKLFFTQGGVNYVCSGSVVFGGGPQHDIIATAGHCVSNGAGTWSENYLFCPSYNDITGINPARGCWAAEFGNLATTFTDWHLYGQIEADVGCIIANDTGTVWNDNIGDVTGTLGRAWNWGADEPEASFGYPAAHPFPGNMIITAMGPEWYTYDWDGGFYGLADAKYMGNDMTGGSSGGPWIMGLGHNSKERPDTDWSSETDPPSIGTAPYSRGYLNGVNSHRRSGFSQEVGSAQFMSGSMPDTELLWSYCQSLANTY